MVNILKDGTYVMISTKKNLFEGFVYCVSRLRDFKIKSNKWTYTIKFENPEEALKCFHEMNPQRGLELILTGKIMKIQMTEKFVTVIT